MDDSVHKADTQEERAGRKVRLLNPLAYQPGPAKLLGIRRDDPAYWHHYDAQRKAYKAQWKRDRTAERKRNADT